MGSIDFSQNGSSRISACLDCDLIHLATHSFFDPEQAEESYIALAGKERDSKLFARDLVEMQFTKGLELIVMSSCASGRASFASGGDPYGLTRGWFLAGARRVVSTFDEVNDQKAYSFMEKFYDIYSQNNFHHPVKALNQATATEVEDGNLSSLLFKLEGIN